MKRVFALTLALILVLSLAACGGSSGNTATPAADDGSTPAAASQNGGNAGNGDGESLEAFASASGISSLPPFPDSEVSYERAGSLTVIFTAQTDITDETFLPYAREVFDICKASSPDGVYDIDYDNYSKGDDVPVFPEDEWAGMLMAFWYYTHGEYIAQMYLSVEENVLKVQINSVYNADTNERAKP